MADLKSVVDNDNSVDTNSIPMSSSQPILSTRTPGSNKRPIPDSPDDLPATEKQQQRQIRRRNSIGNLSDILPKKAPASATRKSIADKVLDALTSQDVLSKIVSILSQKICETIESTINTTVEDKVQQCIDTHVRPLTVKIHEQNDVIKEQEQLITKQANEISVLDTSVKDHTWALKEQAREIDALYSKLLELELRIESQEQYSRRTSLRFHNIKVPVNQKNEIIHPVNTDELVLKVCNEKLGLNISLNDIGRSHVIGAAKEGKAQVIVRFISYRTRQAVYSNKKALKNDADKVFITENLTKFRTGIVKRLAELKFEGVIETYWTADGRIFLKHKPESKKLYIKNHDDIDTFLSSL